MQKEVYSGRFIKVIEDENEGNIYEKAYIQDCIIILPFINDNEILFIKEKRIQEDPPVRTKLVTGFYEPEYSLEENVNRELQEEIGKKASRIQLYETAKYTGTLNQTIYFALAFDLSDSKIPNPDGEDVILDIFPMSIDDIYEYIMEEGFPVSGTGFILAKLYHDIKIKKKNLYEATFTNA